MLEWSKNNLRALRELYRILLDSELKDDERRGNLEARPFQAWGLVVGGREGGGGLLGGQMQGIQMDCSENREVGSSAATCPWWGKVRGVNKAC